MKKHDTWGENNKIKQEILQLKPQNEHSKHTISALALKTFHWSCQSRITANTSPTATMNESPHFLLNWASFFTKVQNVIDERLGETGDTHLNKIRCVTNGHKRHKVGLRAGGWTPNNAVIAVGSDWVPSVIPKSPFLTHEYFNVLSWLKRNSHRYIDR